jgi:AraC family transcriptional activator of pobA
MKKKMDLKNFSVYHYLKEKHSPYSNAPFFLADQDTYKNASIRFPFRTFTYGIGVTYTTPGGIFKIGSRDYKLQPGSLTTIGPGIVSLWTGDYSSKHDTIYFTEELFRNTLNTSFLKSLSFFLPGGTHMVILSDGEVEQMKTLLELIKKLKDDTNVVTGIIYSLLMLVVKRHRDEEKSPSYNYSKREELVGNFNSLLSKHFQEQKDVAFYAAQLNITPKYLSEISISETGKTAKTLILEYVHFEAKSLLRQTNMTIQEICNWLGYSDASYFTKTFKNLEGTTPLEYRKLSF